MEGPVGGGTVVRLTKRDTPPAEALISANPVDVVGEVVTVNVALATLAATVTVAGTCATAVFVLERVTDVAAPVADASVTVPCTLWPPTTWVEARVSEDSCLPVGAGSVTVNDANRETPPNTPVIEAEVALATVSAVMVNVAVVAPGVTVTLGGTVATAVLLLESDTEAPPAGAPPFSVTVPVAVPPLLTTVGDIERADRVTPDPGDTFSTAVCVTCPAVAEIAAKSGEATGWLVTVKEPEVLPAGIVSAGGTVATEVLLLVQPTTVPPAGAAPVSVTVATELVPATTSVGLRTIDATAGSDPPPGPDAAVPIADLDGATDGSSPQPAERIENDAKDSRKVRKRGRKGMGSSSI